MKWIVLITSIILMTGCCCTNDVIEYRQVMVGPSVEPLVIYPQRPLDVTTTTIDYY